MNEDGDAPAAGAEVPVGGKLKAWLQLCRIPNVFTALADVAMGYLVVNSLPFAPEGASHSIAVFVLLGLASALLYTAGMVLNDVFDLEVDARERPARPLPSGRISPVVARLFGYELLATGAGAGWLASYVAGDIRPGIIATLLAGCVWVYDGALKRTPLAPVAMGGCRFLNVLLGMSAASGAWQSIHFLIAAGIGLYIVGVTWFARTEARQSNQASLVGATGIVAAGIALLASGPLLADVTEQLAVPLGNWYLLWLLLGMSIVWRLIRAALQPDPPLVQTAVKVCIFSLVVLDAAVVFGWHGYDGPGIPWVVLVLLLLIPTTLLGRWIYST